MIGGLVNRGALNRPGSSPFLGIDHIQLAAPAGCEEQARRFYGELLGLLELPKPETLAGSGGVWFQCGIQELHIGVDPDFLPARKAHPALQVVNRTVLKALAAHLELEGVAVEFDDRLPGRQRFYTSDPFGNRLEIICAQE